MNDVVIKRFEAADEMREFEKGRFEVVKIGDVTVGRASYEPGWKWSRHVGPVVGKKSCDVDPVGLVLQGRAMVKMDDGREFELTAGDFFSVGPGHDSWVVSDEPYVLSWCENPFSHPLERKPFLVKRRKGFLRE